MEDTLMMLRFYAMTAENVSVSLKHFPFSIFHFSFAIEDRTARVLYPSNEK
jgi:hypothetical protein